MAEYDLGEACCGAVGAKGYCCFLKTGAAPVGASFSAVVLRLLLMEDPKSRLVFGECEPDRTEEMLGSDTSWFVVAFMPSDSATASPAEAGRSTFCLCFRACKAAALDLFCPEGVVGTDPLWWLWTDVLEFSVEIVLLATTGLAGLDVTGYIVGATDCLEVV